MTNFFDIGDADDAVIHLISQVEAGKDFFVTRDGKPVALIIKFEVESREEFVKLTYDAGKGLLPEWTDEEWEKSDAVIRAAWGQCKSCQAKNDENLDSIVESGNGDKNSSMAATEKPTRFKFGLFKGLMEPVSDEEWEKMDEEIRANFVDDDLV